jgi:S1-C subfamily serine protease
MVTNGVLDLADRGVVMIHSFRSELDPPGTCSASLIRPDVLLTAAHCVIDRKTGRTKGVRTVGANSRKMVAVKPHPQFDNGVRYDVALVQLEGDLAGGTVVAFSSELPKEGDWMRVVGFGGNQYTDTRGVVEGVGVKRTGWTKVTHLDDHFIYTRGMRNATPSDSNRPTGRDVALAGGDSGGPMLNREGVIVGIAAQINSQHVPASETLSIIVAHTQVAAVVDFINGALAEFGGVRP